METLDEALRLVGPTFPYAEADDPVLWELINQATHLEIRPYIEEDSDGCGTPPVLVRGRRDPVYEAADTVLGLSRREDRTAGPRTAWVWAGLARAVGGFPSRPRA